MPTVTQLTRLGPRVRDAHMVIIPRVMLEQLGLEVGDEVSIEAKDGAIYIRKAEAKPRGQT